MLGEEIVVDSPLIGRHQFRNIALAIATAEELARFIWDELRGALEKNRALGGITSLEIAVAEGPGQAAIYEASV